MSWNAKYCSTFTSVRAVYFFLKLYIFLSAKRVKNFQHAKLNPDIIGCIVLQSVYLSLCCCFDSCTLWWRMWRRPTNARSTERPRSLLTMSSTCCQGSRKGSPCLQDVSGLCSFYNSWIQTIANMNHPFYQAVVV